MVEHADDLCGREHDDDVLLSTVNRNGPGGGRWRMKGWGVKPRDVKLGKKNFN